MTLDGKVAFITGAARGQGRAHAVRLAREGVKIIGVDICEDIASMDYPNATADDLAETVKHVEALGGAMIGTKADVRSYDAVKTAVDEGVERYGRLDIVIQPEDIANTVAWLVSDEAKFITGVALPLDAGFTIR
jgi:(+)-trans-carveol dehydrogenase